MKELEELRDAAVVEAAPDAPRRLALDRGYAYDACRGAAAARGYEPHLPPKASAERPPPPPGDPDRHPPRRRAVAVAHARFHRFRRLPTRSEKRAGHDPGFVRLAAALIGSRKLRHARSLSG